MTEMTTQAATPYLPCSNFCREAHINSLRLAICLDKKVDDLCKENEKLKMQIKKMATKDVEAAVKAAKEKCEEKTMPSPKR